MNNNRTVIIIYAILVHQENTKILPISSMVTYHLNWDEAGSDLGRP